MLVIYVQEPFLRAVNLKGIWAGYTISCELQYDGSDWHEKKEKNSMYQIPTTPKKIKEVESMILEKKFW